VKKVNEFEITGNGSNHEWGGVAWYPLAKLDSRRHAFLSQFKILYSQSGIYILFQGQDNKITTLEYEDMDKIWNRDVFEVFLHPDPQVSILLIC